MTKPNYKYLQQKVGIKNETQLKEKLLERCKKLNMKQVANDVKPFLFNPNDMKKVELFADYIRQVDLD